MYVKSRAIYRIRTKFKEIYAEFLYGGYWLKENLNKTADDLLVKCPLWLSQYGPKAVLPVGWKKYTLWQRMAGCGLRKKAHHEPSSDDADIFWRFISRKNAKQRANRTTAQELLFAGPLRCEENCVLAVAEALRFARSQFGFAAFRLGAKQIGACTLHFSGTCISPFIGRTNGPVATIMKTPGIRFRHRTRAGPIPPLKCCAVFSASTIVSRPINTGRRTR